MQKDLRIGDNLKIVLVGGDCKYYTITGVDKLYYRDAHSALAAAGTETYTEITNLDPPTNQLYFIKAVETDCNVKVYLKQPAATNRLGTNKSPDGGLLSSNSISIQNARDINFYVLENYPPNVQLVNGTNVSITPILWWIGYRYSMKIIEKPAVYTTIKVGGIAE